MKMIFVFFLLVSQPAQAQIIDVFWSENYRKEIQINCSAGDIFCENVCGVASACYLSEGPCRNCIGTSLQIHHIFSEIGRSIHRTDMIGAEVLQVFLLQGNFVTFTALDAYNLIDAHRSLGVLKKFESMCPEESLNQILFYRVHEQTRKLLNPEYLYCQFEGRAEFFKIQDKLLY
jgi:hypothetical protein